MVECQETLHVFWPLSERAKEWIDEHVRAEPWHWLGERFGVEHRCAPPLCEAMRATGLRLRQQPLWAK